MLKKVSGKSLTDQMVDMFEDRIKTRLLEAGARLPSVRACAEQQGVSPSTVVAAYDQLLARGLVEARKNRGFFVREADPASPRRTRNLRVVSGDASEPEEVQRQPFSATALIRGMFAKTDKPQPGMGVLPPDWLESTFMPAAVRKMTSISMLQEMSLQYGDPAGDEGLRRALSQKLSAFGISANSEQIITTIGATHALDIVSRTLLRSGDAVMVDEPGWSMEFARLDSLGMRILPVPRLANGPDIAVMQRYCEEHSPKLFVSVSVLHNPTGGCIAPAVAYRVVQLAQQFDFHIAEDDTYCHFAPDHSTRLCALDGLQRTIYVGGFAKILAPNWRVGYLAAPPNLKERLLDTKLLGTLTTPALFERSLALCIEQGMLRRHSERIRAKLDQARARTVKLALAAGCTFAAEPAGVFGWVDTGMDTDELAQRMLDSGCLIAPGSLFHARRRPGTLMRINFATAQDAEFWKKLAKMRKR